MENNKGAQVFNVIYITYNPQKGLIEKHLENWRKIPDEIRSQFRFILVDDCSTVPVDPVVDFPIRLTIARVDDDIYWNPPGAKNVGFTLADTDWIFSSDIDHFVPANHYERILNLPTGKKNMYFFERFKPDGSSRNKNSTNLFVIHYEDFWNTGGYDEDFCGAHGYDDHLIIGNVRYPQQISIMKQQGMNFVQTKIPIVEHSEYATGDAGKKAATNSINLPKLNEKLQQLKAGVYEHGPILRFKYHIAKEYFHR